MNHPAPAGHCGHRALNLAVIDMPLHRLSDPLQRLRGHADRLCLGGGNFTAADSNCRDSADARILSPNTYRRAPPQKKKQNLGTGAPCQRRCRPAARRNPPQRPALAITLFGLVAG